jgi:hypothetical protein
MERWRPWTILACSIIEEEEKEVFHDNSELML